MHARTQTHTAVGKAPMLYSLYLYACACASACACACVQHCSQTNALAQCRRYTRQRHSQLCCTPLPYLEMRISILGSARRSRAASSQTLYNRFAQVAHTHTIALLHFVFITSFFRPTGTHSSLPPRVHFRFEVGTRTCTRTPLVLYSVHRATCLAAVMRWRRW